MGSVTLPKMRRSQQTYRGRTRTDHLTYIGVLRLKKAIKRASFVFARDGVSAQVRSVPLQERVVPLRAGVHEE